MNVHSHVEAASPGKREGGSATREALLAAALELFEERGFHGTAVPLVAARAGVAAGTMYRHFASKEALVNQLYRATKGRLMRALFEGLDVPPDPRAAFGEFWRRLAAFAAAEPRALSFLELHHHAPYLDRESLEIERQSLLPIVQFFEEASRAGVTKRVAPAALISIVWGAFVGLLRAARLGHLALDAEVVAAGEACAWDAVSVHAPAGAANRPREDRREKPCRASRPKR